ncbi:MAG: hypothetical protein ACK4IX_12050 [Candidatus Sericytochromatia bacterium]
MLKVAILDENLMGQLEANKDYVQYFDIVFSGKTLEMFYNYPDILDVKALIVDITLLGSNPEKTLEEISQKTKLEQVIVLYSFEKKELIQKIDNQSSKPIKKPVNFRMLKVYLISLIIKEMSKERKEKNEEIQNLKSTLNSNDKDLTRDITDALNKINLLEENNNLNLYKIDSLNNLKLKLNLKKAHEALQESLEIKQDHLNKTVLV